MSMPLDQQQQLPPSMTLTQYSDTSYSRHGSVGPLIAVLAVITILGALAAMIGRLCSGRRIMGHGQYDVEGWLEEKCASCIDGRLNPPPPPIAHITSGSASHSIPVQTHEEAKQEERKPQNPPPNADS